MSQITLLMAIHNHQPVGNFDHIFETAVNQCYRPFFEILERYPDVRISIHFTGPLLEWIAEHTSDIFPLLRQLVERDQIEMMGGAFYEPILAAIPERDSIGQIRWMSDYLQEHFAVTPSGMWLAERVWDPAIPKIASCCDIRYTLLDDVHFRYAGVPPYLMNGYYVTEKEGFPLAVFPIDKALRYRIPFYTVPEVIDYLRSRGSNTSGITLTYGDDGEKFGLWPGTYDWVYQKNWLSDFFTALTDNQMWLTTQPLGEYLPTAPATGRVYLPLGSYEEMNQWSLPEDQIPQYQALRTFLNDHNRHEDTTRFVSGGQWMNFLVKYPHANAMHKRMLYLSDKVAAANIHYAPDNPPNEKALLTALYRAQCNCGYWHGIFGGLYLNHLRHAIYHHTITAEHELMKHHPDLFPQTAWLDYDKDFEDELILTTPTLKAIVKPNYSGCLTELDLIPYRFNIMNTFSRVPESYHQTIRDRCATQNSSTPSAVHSIHDEMPLKEGDLDQKLAYDRHIRHNFLDTFYDKNIDCDAFAAGRRPEALTPFPWRYTPDHRRKTLVATPRLWPETHPIQIDITKQFSLTADQLTVHYHISPKIPYPETVQFGVELNFTLLADTAPDRYARIHSDATDGTAQIPLSRSVNGDTLYSMALINKFDHFQLKIIPTCTPRFTFNPIYTVNQSDDGYETTYQGQTCTLLWSIPLTVETSTIRIDLLCSPA